jgi:heme-degrading monooxygenase HmoA
MLCALTVRTLKPGTFDQFREAFMHGMDPDNPPPGWVRFNMVRGTENPDEVVCFGFFDGTLDELRNAQTDERRAEQLREIAGFVESTGPDAFYEVVEDLSITDRAPH